jgi:hypothetical protein
MLVVASVWMALGANADTLGSVTAAVRRLSGREPVHGALTIAQSVKSSGRFANDATSRLATVDVTHDPAGLTISIPQALLDKAAQSDRGALDGIGAIRPLNVIETLNYRDVLLKALTHATVVEEKRVVFRGRTARLLVLKVEEPKEKKSGSIVIGSVKSDDRLSLWIDDADLPLAAERTVKSTAGFMFLHGSYDAQSSYSFLHKGDRLLVTRLEVKESGSGAGQNVAKDSLQTFAAR